MNFKNNTKIILLLSIGLLLIPGCHKSPTVEEIILNDPFLVTHTYFWYHTLISSDALQAVKDKKMSQEEQDTAKTACIKILENAQPLLENGDNADGSMNMDRRLLEAGLNRLLANNNCLAIFRNFLGVKNPPTLIFPISNSINFPIVKGALYDYVFDDYKGYYAIVTFEDFIKNKQLIQEFYFEGEGTNIKLDKILVTGKVESKGYFYQSDVNKEIYSLVIRPDSMPNIKIITLAAFNKSAEVMQESKINDNYKLECFIFGDKQRITEDNSHEDLVYIMDKCNPLIPERFDYKPDKIERVNNYLKNMIQCKHNELYFDGKCHNILLGLPKTDIPSNNAVDSSNTNNTTIMQIHADNSTSPCDGIDFYGQCTKLNGTVTFGSYPQNTDTPEPIEWRVLNKNDKGQILLISEKVLDRKTYYTREIAAITWEKSTIRSWLNGYTASYNTAGINFTNDNFINKAFTAEEQTKITNSNIPAHNNPDFNIPPGNATTDKIFLLSTVEAANYFPDNAARQADATRYVVKKGEFVLGSESMKTTSDGTCSDNHCYASWWLRSPGGTSGIASGADVNINGSINTTGCIVEYPSGIRPAMWVTLAKRAYSEPTPPPTNPSAQAPAQPTAIPNSSSSTESSILYNTSGSWKIQLHGNIPTSEGQKIALLLNQWNDAMNQHNADAVAKTHTNNAGIRGKFYTIEAYRDKEAKAFKKHPDFAQTPVSDVYAAPLQNKKGYYLIFDLTFSQGGKDTRTEIMLVVLHDGVNYKIDYESDISTDRNLIKKMLIYTDISSEACTQLGAQILMESPQFRYDFIPDELLSLSLVCENDECLIGIGEDGIVVEDYEFDYQSMQFTIEKRYFNDSEYTYTIHPKYTSQIRQLCP